MDKCDELHAIVRINCYIERQCRDTQSPPEWRLQTAAVVARDYI
jgi:hypothetical protein